MSNPRNPPEPLVPAQTERQVFPRYAVVMVALGALGGMIYLGSRGNDVGTICCAVILLSVIGADLGAIIRAYRGLPDPPPTTPPPARTDSGAPP